jgi:mono/diheme cytochrome c family protein
MLSRKLIGGTLLMVACAHCGAQENFPPDKIKQGSGIYSQNCAPCHGPRMADPQGGFDLRTFPPDQKGRFMNSVTNGKNSMPPWGGLFSADEIETLWAYVMAGEKK